MTSAEGEESEKVADGNGTVEDQSASSQPPTPKRGNRWNQEGEFGHSGLRELPNNKTSFITNANAERRGLNAFRVYGLDWVMPKDEEDWFCPLCVQRGYDKNPPKLPNEEMMVALQQRWDQNEADDKVREQEKAAELARQRELYGEGAQEGFGVSGSEGGGGPIGTGGSDGSGGRPLGDVVVAKGGGEGDRDWGEEGQEVEAGQKKGRKRKPKDGSTSRKRKSKASEGDYAAVAYGDEREPTETAKRMDEMIEFLDSQPVPSAPLFSHDMKGYSSGFGSIVWALTTKALGPWPACVYDPRLTLEGGGAWEAAYAGMEKDKASIAQAGEGVAVEKRYLVWLFGFSEAEGNFVICGPGKVVDWDAGVGVGFGRGRDGLQKLPAPETFIHGANGTTTEGSADSQSIPKLPDWPLKELKGKRAKEFTKAVKQALSEKEKDVTERMDWNH